MPAMDDHGRRSPLGSSSHAMPAAGNPERARLSTATTPRGQLHVTGSAGRGISPGRPRVSADLEDGEDLVVDFAVGLAAVRSAVPA
jgi:hypothetical protein